MQFGWGLSAGWAVACAGAVWAGRGRGSAAHMRAMALIWAVILVGGIAYFSVIGLSGH